METDIKLWSLGVGVSNGSCLLTFCVALYSTLKFVFHSDDGSCQARLKKQVVVWKVEASLLMLAVIPLDITSHYKSKESVCVSPAYLANRSSDRLQILRVTHWGLSVEFGAIWTHVRYE